MAENEVDSAAIDAECLVHSIKARMSPDLFMSPNRCIFKTPTILRELNEKAYVPDAFSIGPFHHGEPKFEEMEKIKSKYLQGLISRSLLPDEMLTNLINSIKDVEREAREFYAGPIVCSRDEFVEMLVIDGCFIIELFCKQVFTELRGDNDPIFSTACMRQFLAHDLILLENQVPWIILERLFNLAMHLIDNNARQFLAHDLLENQEPRIKRDHLFNLAMDLTHNNANAALIGLVKSFVTKSLGIDLLPAHPPNQEIKHILDLIRKLLVSSTRADEDPTDWTTLPSATSLVEAGVKIRKGESKSFLDIKFDNGVLYIPQLEIQETTESFFRNIISFEQCYPNCEPKFTSYAMLLDNLTNTSKDVDILSENEIIKNWLNPEDAVPFFNKLYYNTRVTKAYFQSLCKEVNEYCNRRWPKWRAVLVGKYFNTPWAVLSTVGAVILLISPS
ncbi:LOW QUALITY PROTEIN: UPF0481 protein At3g47200 [Quercus suber]|uniref:LOW QUALITY PROTEIN: UPF0481 protein At3g47200 n=1 Tax=Quercus suber TaxID=58331 RepID=UPI0032DEAC66